jgi:hypothetical protein
VSAPEDGRLLWLGAPTLCGTVTVVLVAVGASPTYRTPVVVAFLLACPGMPLVRLLALSNQALEWSLAIALSLSLDVLVASGLIYSGVWSPDLTLVILVSLTAVASALAAVRRRPSRVG